MSSSPAPINLNELTFVDLSMPIEPHWRFGPEFWEKEIPTPEFTFHSTSFKMGAHGFSHVDAPYHIDPQGKRILDLDPTQFYGPASIVDVSDLGDNAELTEEVLSSRCGHVLPGDILLLRSDQELRHPSTTPEFWTQSPYVSRSGTEYLLGLGITMIGFDFPQDRAIRADYDPSFEAGVPIEDWACHMVLLAAGVLQIEYLAGLHAITKDRFTLFAVPLALKDSDGGPARVFALEDRS